MLVLCVLLTPIISLNTLTFFLHNCSFINNLSTKLNYSEAHPQFVKVYGPIHGQSTGYVQSSGAADGYKIDDFFCLLSLFLLEVMSKI